MRKSVESGVPTYTRRDIAKFSLVGAGAVLVPGLAYAQQPDLTFYFEKTGHHLSGPTLDFWRRHQNGLLTGDPITEARPLPDGTVEQYFENCLLKFQPGNPEGIQVAPLGHQMTPKDMVASSDERSLGIDLAFYQKHDELLGSPHSITITNGTSRTQFFRGFKLREHLRPPVAVPAVFTNNDFTNDPFRNYLLRKGVYKRLLYPGEVEVLPLGKDATESRGIDISPVIPKPEALVYTPSLFDATKLIVVTISNQTITAYEDGTQVMETKVSTGGDPDKKYPGYNSNTPLGEFKVLDKMPVKRYQSYDPKRSFDIRGIPSNLRFSSNEFIHGTFWHDSFGTARSAGCVNLNNDDAAWVYEWAPVNTRVNVVA